MPKLTRYLQKIFANNSNEVGVFGTGVDKETSKNVETLQSADYEEGWSSAIITNKNYPIWQEMDGVQYGLSYQLKYLFQNGMPEWISTETYYTNNYCSYGGYIYQSLQDNNINHNPALNDGYWTVYSSVPDDRLHALKSYEDSGELLTDSEGLADVKYYAHSTFDLSKFTVVGTPTITDDGIASGFSGSKYLTVNNIDFSQDFVFESPVFNTNSQPNIQSDIVYSSTTNSLVELCILSNGHLKTLLKGTSDILRNESLTISLNTNYQIKITKVGTTYSAFYKTDVSDWTLYATSTSSLLLSNSSTLSIGMGGSGGNYPFDGSIDLKQFSITVDGVETFSGNKTGTDTYSINGSTVTIPYTLSKTGSKIVDSAYRTDITSVYNFQGYAPYYTLSDTDFTLPQGELYGLIEKCAKDIAHPVGVPFYRFDDTINDDEVRLEGAEVDKGLYLAIEQKLSAYCTAGSTADKICLPDFRNRVIWGASNFGYISAGLPNITGYLGTNDFEIIPSDSVNQTGALTCAKGDCYSVEAGGFQNNVNSISFNASLSNSIYGNSTTVQPPAVKVRWLARWK